MSNVVLTPETPENHWQAIRFTPVSAADYETTYRLLGKEPELRQELGALGLYLATHIRSYQFGELVTLSGEKFDDMKFDPIWLVCETACLMGAIEQEAERTYILN